MKLSIIFVEPESSGNIGSLARVMANFNLLELILVNPKCKIDGKTKMFAKHAFNIVEKARVLKSFDKLIKEFDMVVGTTGSVKDRYDTIRAWITPSELKSKLSDERVAIVFGREGDGLSNKELELCDLVVSIPTSKKYAIMNITHAAAIIFYEMFSLKESSIKRASKKDKQTVFRLFDGFIDKSEGIRDKKAVKKVFRNIINKSQLTKKEARTLNGVFKKS